MSVDIAKDVKFQPMTINVDVDSICIRLNSTTRITLDTIVIIPVAPMILPASDTSNISKKSTIINGEIATQMQAA